EGAARIWYEKEPPNSILTWDDLVNKFDNQFFPPSKTTHLKNEISRFTQRFEETFGEAWERFKEMLGACPHHGFLELTQIDTFYNGLNEQDQDSLNAAVGGNLLNKTTREALKIIENKSKVRYSRSKLNVSRVNTNSRDSVSKTDDRIDKLADQISNLVEIVNKQVITLATAKAVEKTCVICGGAHAYYDCIATDRIDVCHALADLGASINLMPLSIWKKLLLPEVTPTRMTLELVDRSIARPKGVAEDVFVKVGKFHFPTDFMVVDFEADPRVPLILRRSFLRTGRALIDVYGEEITLKVNDESVNFNLNQTMRYSLTYDDNSVNRVDVIDIACEEFVQDVLDFQYNPKSSNSTLVSNPLIFESDFSKEPIVKSSSPTLTPFGESDFFLEEIKDFLNDESIPTGIENSLYDPEGDILFLEKFLNEDPFKLPSMDLKQAEETKAKSSIEEPPELELKELPSHLEYAFLEESNKLPVIITKDLKMLKRSSHKSLKVSQMEGY
nr:reverse transcriptase domain-containing protein [Tanacetum cinerariifolium]